MEVLGLTHSQILVSILARRSHQWTTVSLHPCRHNRLRQCHLLPGMAPTAVTVVEGASLSGGLSVVVTAS